jgi:hypothetical protein
MANGAGAGELAAAGLGTALCISTSMLLPLPGSLLLLSLLVTPFSLFSLLLPSAETTAGSSDGTSGLGLGGAFHRGTSQATPVKLLSWKPPLAHFRQGFPDRSRARRPALMAPWLALGPSLCAAVPLVFPPSTRVPSSLQDSQYLAL